MWVMYEKNCNELWNDYQMKTGFFKILPIYGLKRIL